MISARKVISLIIPDNAFYQVPADILDIADDNITDHTTPFGGREQAAPTCPSRLRADLEILELDEAHVQGARCGSLGAVGREVAREEGRLERRALGGVAPAEARQPRLERPCDVLLDQPLGLPAFLSARSVPTKNQGPSEERWGGWGEPARHA